MIQNLLSELGPWLVANFPLLFFIAYEAFFIPVGLTTWGLVLTAPLLIPLLSPSAITVFLQMPEIAAARRTCPRRHRLSHPKLKHRCRWQRMAPTVASPAGAPAFGTRRGCRCGCRCGAGAGARAFPYVVAFGGDPEAGFWPTVGGRGGLKAPAATIPAAAAAVTSAGQSGRGGAGGPPCTITAMSSWI